MLGLRWKEFERDGKVSIKEREFYTSKGRERFINRVSRRKNFVEIYSFETFIQAFI